MTKSIFVFGSNYAGRHGRGAALCALKEHGAIYGRGEGIQGFSYALPTKSARIHTLPLEAIKQHVDKFITCANNNPEFTFEVTRIGCGLAGYTDTEIAPMFVGAPMNCNLPEGWREY